MGPSIRDLQLRDVKELSWTLVTLPLCIGPMSSSNGIQSKKLWRTVLLSTGEKIPLDVIIFGTGFYLASIQYDADHHCLL